MYNTNAHQYRHHYPHSKSKWIKQKWNFNCWFPENLNFVQVFPVSLLFDQNFVWYVDLEWWTANDYVNVLLQGRIWENTMMSIQHKKGCSKYQMLFYYSLGIHNEINDMIYAGTLPPFIRGVCESWKNFCGIYYI